MIEDLEDGDDLASLPRESLVARARALQTVLRVARAVATARTVEDLAAHFAEAVAACTRFPSVVVFRFSQAEDVFEFVAQHGFDESKFPAGARRLPANGSLTGLAAERRQILVTDDIAGDERLDRETRSALSANDYTSGACVPVIHAGQVLGSFNLVYPRGTALGADEHGLLGTLATSLAVAMAQQIAVERERQLEEQLRQSQKMEAIGHLAGGIAHDFNNLLTVINGQAAILGARDLASEQSEALSEISLAAKRAASLTRQLLTFSRRQVLHSRELDLNDVVTGLASMLRRILGEDLQFQLKLHPSPLLTRADAAMLEQVIMNLVVNARDAMPDGGALVIETDATNVTTEECVRLPDARPGPYVRLHITDNGCGMSPEVLEHIFEPFFTTKEIGKGTGLGLATVFGIVKQHGGALRVTSEVGRGTTFVVLLPAVQHAALAPASAEPFGAPRGGAESILLVEDEEPVRRLVQRLLEMQGYRVRVASSGVEALRLWKQGENDFDLVLTDLVMPGGVSGQQLTEQLTTLRPGLKVIHMSGYASEVAGPSIELREGISFLQKPFDPAALLACVRTRLDET